MDVDGIAVSDAHTMELVEVAPCSLILTLGEENDMYDFILMEEQRLIRVDEMDAAILEMTSEEVA